MAVERAAARFLNPRDIPVYEWISDGSTATAVRTPLTNFTRVRLRTLYLRRNYSGQTEDLWHMVDEPYSYPAVTSVVQDATTPRSFTLSQNFPNPFNPSTSIGFQIPYDARVRVDVFDAAGQIVDVLVYGFRPQGSHLVRWDASRRASGVYFYRLLSDGVSAVKSMMLVR